MSLTDTLDSFFLTKPLVTSDLKLRVETVKNELTNMQFEFSDKHNEFTMVQADLLKMEEKSDYLNAELEKALALFEVPPDGDATKAHEFMMRYIHDPAEWASLYGGAAGGGLWLFSKIGPKFLNVLSKAKKFSSASKVAKSAKWMKIAKLGKASIIFSVVVFAADFVVQIMAAGVVNKELRATWEELTRQSKIARKELKKLKATLAEAIETRDEILKEAGAANIAEFVKSLNGAITSLGRQAGYMRTARRMLLAGLPVDNVELFVQDLPPKSVASLARKLNVEKGIVNGKNVEELAEQNGFNKPELAAIAKLMEARADLVKGATEKQVVVAKALPEAVVEGLADTVDDDEQHATSQLARGVSTEQAAAQSMLPISHVESLQAQAA